MKTGIIVYVVGNEADDNNFDTEKAIRELDIQADRVELVFSGDNHFDVMEAWWKLTTKGMSKIVCMFGEIINSSAIQLTGREFQLSGYC